MLHITNSFTKHVPAKDTEPARDIKVFITDIVMEHKDKVVLKHLVNSNVNIMKLPNIKAAHELAKELDAENRLVTSQKDVNIRYKAWHLSKSSSETEGEKSHTPCSDPSVGPEHIYNESVVNRIIDYVMKACETAKFKSTIDNSTMFKCVAKALYGDFTGFRKFDDNQLALIKFAIARFTDRYCVPSQFNAKAYTIGSELMCKMAPAGTVYRANKYTRHLKKSEVKYFVINGDTITNCKTGEITNIEESTFGKRSAMRTKIDMQLYYSRDAK